MPGDSEKVCRRPFTVLVEGNIGCGKTTFLQHFSKLSDVNVLKEPVDRWRNVNGHNLLQLMYEDPKRWSMPFQSYVQLTMLDQHLHTSHQPIKLMERSIFSARYCFVENLYRSGNLHGSEFSALSHWFDFLTNSPDLDLKVDLIIYLRTQPEQAMERVKARGRGEENTIPLSYLTMLHNLHEEWLIERQFPLPAPVLVIDANKDLTEMEKVYAKYEDIILGHNRMELPDVVSDASALLAPPAL